MSNISPWKNNFGKSVSEETCTRHLGSRTFDRYFKFNSHTILEERIEVSELTPRGKDRMLALAREVKGPYVLVFRIRRATPKFQQFFQQQKLNYMDDAGNCHVEADGLFLHVQGIPLKGGRDQELDGGLHGRILREIKRARQFNDSLRSLANKLDVSHTAVSKSIKLLEAKGLIVRRPDGIRLA